MSFFLKSYKEKIAYTDEKFNPVVLQQNERVKVILTCFRSGQFIPVHAPGVDLTLTVLEGEGRIVAGEVEESLQPGAIAFISAGEKRGIKAETELVILNAVTPPPGDGDHTQVKAKLQQQTWR